MGEGVKGFRQRWGWEAAPSLAPLHLEASREHPASLAPSLPPDGHTDKDSCILQTDQSGERLFVPLGAPGWSGVAEKGIHSPRLLPWPLSHSFNISKPGLLSPVMAGESLLVASVSSQGAAPH